MLYNACGAYATNCYIINTKEGAVVIDPGVDAHIFVQNNCEKLIAILNTHGHHDHVWSNELLRQKYKAKIYIHEDDGFLLQDPFNTGFIKHEADVLLKDKDVLSFGELQFTFHLFNGHTPGCCMIEHDKLMFSGDFLFSNSIGRYDFPYSNAKDMLKSLEKAALIKKDFILYPGHGEKTTLFKEQALLPGWIRLLKSEL